MCAPLTERPPATGSDSCLTSDNSPLTALYEDDLVLALMTAEASPTASLVKTTTDVLYLNLSEVDARCGHGAWTVMRRRASRASEAPSAMPDGVACGSDWALVSREPVRVYIHVFPRYEGDPFYLVADWSLTLTPLRLDQIAGRIRRAYEERARPTTGAGSCAESAAAAAR